MKHIITSLVSIIVPLLNILAFFLIGGEKVYAYHEVEIPQEVLNISNILNQEEPQFETIEYEEVDRVEKLQKFFEKYNSPLHNNAKTFVEVADKYGLDYRIMPAIAGVESTFAKFYIPKTNNPFGWGGGLIEFSSFDEAIEGVGLGLYKGYVVKGRNTVETIAPIYNPPHPVTWAQKVNYFMNEISNI